MSRLLGVLGHETLHAVNDDGTENPYRDEAEKLKEQGYNQKEINDKLKAKYGDDYTEQVEEDRRAHVFDTKIWNSLSKQFAIFDLEMYDKSKALEQGNEYFNSYLDYNYTMGADLQDSDITPEQAYLNKRNFLNSIRERYYEEKEREEQSSQDEQYIDMMSRQYMTAMESFYNFRGTYINSIEDNMSDYDINDFNKDLYAAFGITLDNSTTNEEDVLENDNSELSEDYDLLVDSQLNTIVPSYMEDNIITDYRNSHPDTILNNDEIKEEYMKNYYGNEFNNIFNMLFTRDSSDNFMINDQTLTNLQYMVNGYSEENNGEVTEYSGIVEGFDASEVGYENSSLWFMEGYHERITFSDSETESINKVNNRISFFRYYLGQSNEDMQNFVKKLSGKTINVDDSSDNNGVCNTHMIANIDMMLDALTVLHNGTGGENGIGGDWESVTWVEGYRSRKDMANMGSRNYNSNHLNNNAIDLLNISVDGSNIFETNDVDRNAVADLFETAYDSGYFNEFELKGTGFHWGRSSTSEPDGGYTDTQKKVLYGNFPSDSERYYNYWLNDVSGVLVNNRGQSYDETYTENTNNNGFTYGYRYSDDGYVYMKDRNSSIDFVDEFLEALREEESDEN